MIDPYFNEIEQHFRGLKGRASVMLSPADWQLVATWKVSGIPVVTVLRGINATFREFAARRNGEEINSVKFCQPKIMEEWRKDRVRTPPEKA